jgi:hypothetical protein
MQRRASDLSIWLRWVPFQTPSAQLCSVKTPRRIMMCVVVVNNNFCKAPCIKSDHYESLQQQDSYREARFEWQRLYFERSCDGALFCHSLHAVSSILRFLRHAWIMWFCLYSDHDDHRACVPSVVFRQSYEVATSTFMQRTPRKRHRYLSMMRPNHTAAIVWRRTSVPPLRRASIRFW